MQGIFNSKTDGVAPAGCCRTYPPYLHLQCSCGAAILVRKKGAGASVVRPTWEEAGFPSRAAEKKNMRPMPKVECSLNHTESGGWVYRNPFIKSQLAFIQLTLGTLCYRAAVQISSRPPSNFGVSVQGYSTEWRATAEARSRWGTWDTHKAFCLRLTTPVEGWPVSFICSPFYGRVVGPCWEKLKPTCISDTRPGTDVKKCPCPDDDYELVHPFLAGLRKGDIIAGFLNLLVRVVAAAKGFSFITWK